MTLLHQAAQKAVEAMPRYHMNAENGHMTESKRGAWVRWLDVMSALQHQEEPREPVAEVLSYTNGSYSRNYKLRWIKDVPEGTKLYASPSTTRQQEVGSGWKLVPVEPTREMIRAASVIRATMVNDGEWCVGIGGAIDAYEALLAAAPSTLEKAGGVSERTHDQEPAASYPPGGVKSPGDTAANSSAETKANAIDMLLVKVHQHLAQALRIPTMPWTEPAAHGHEATGRAIHAAYCAMRFKIMDAIAELTAARCGITAAVIEDTTAALPSPIPHPLPAQPNDGGEQ